MRDVIFSLSEIDELNKVYYIDLDIDTFKKICYLNEIKEYSCGDELDCNIYRTIDKDYEYICKKIKTEK